MTCSLAPAHMERLQGRAGHTGAGLGSVSTGREEMWGQRNRSQLERSRQQRWAGREGTANGNPAAGEIWAPPGRALQYRCLPSATPLLSPLLPSTALSPWGHLLIHLPAEEMKCISPATCPFPTDQGRRATARHCCHLGVGVHSWVRERFS